MRPTRGPQNPNGGLANGLRLMGELDPSGTTVASYVLRSHESHIRIVNPAHDVNGSLVRWAESGPSFEARSDVQWREVAGPRQPGRSEPETGTVAPSVLDAILRQLPGGDGAATTVAQWDGYAEATYPAEARRVELPPQRPSSVWCLPAADLRTLKRVPMRWWDPQLRWVVGNDVYARSVFVSGSEAFIRALLNEPGLEAFRVGASDAVSPEDL